MSVQKKELPGAEEDKQPFPQLLKQTHDLLLIKKTLLFHIRGHTNHISKLEFSRNQECV